MTEAGSDLKRLKADMWQRMKESPFIMVGPADGSTHSEPLTAQLDEDQVDTLFFFIARDNRLVNKDRLMMQFVSKGHDFFACIKGRGRIDDDPALIDKLWSDQVESWFPGGRDDPNLALLRVAIDGAELWETDISLAGRVKIMFGGEVEMSEEGSHATTRTTAIGRDA